MPEKDFEIWINATTRLSVFRNTHRGRVLGFSVVLLSLIEEQWVDIARCDSAHGCPHEDVQGRKGGLLRKIWHDNLSYRQAYESAIDRYRRDHETIREKFLAH